jgi:hypothetical protein
MNNMEEVSDVEAAILQTTTDIREQFPATYAHLTETPLFLRVQDSKIRLHDLIDYLETIQHQLSDLIIDNSIRKAKIR